MRLGHCNDPSFGADAPTFGKPAETVQNRSPGFREETGCCHARWDLHGRPHIQQTSCQVRKPKPESIQNRIGQDILNRRQVPSFFREVRILFHGTVTACSPLPRVTHRPLETFH